jgi:hypothetical protein
MNQLVPVSSNTLPALVLAAGERASMRFPELASARLGVARIGRHDPYSLIRSSLRS